MIEITKCADHHCPSRANCWRFVAPARPEQSFADFGRENARECHNYWHVTDNEKRKGGPKQMVDAR